MAPSHMSCFFRDRAWGRKKHLAFLRAELEERIAHLVVLHKLKLWLGRKADADASERCRLNTILIFFLPSQLVVE